VLTETFALQIAACNDPVLLQLIQRFHHGVIDERDRRDEHDQLIGNEPIPLGEFAGSSQSLRSREVL